MRANLLELKRQHHNATTKANNILQATETAGREMTDAEHEDFTMAMAAANDISRQMQQMQSRTHLGEMMTGGGTFITNNGRRFSAQPDTRRIFSQDYGEAFHEWLRSGGQNTMNAALYEGSNSAGGYTVPTMVDGQIVPLAPADTGVRSIAIVIPTANDIKIPRATSISSAAAKAEGTGNGSNLFTESDPLLDQFTLSAFMAGVAHTLSWELVQDVPSFQQFAIGDMLLACQLFEENLFVNGTGTGQAQGLLGNVGAGVTGVLAGSDNYLSELLDATFDVQGTLKGAYQENASWLMSRATAVALRKAQKQSNLYEPLFTSSGGKDFLHGRPVTYSTSMPAIGAGNTPILFGDFKQGYVIGARGGLGVNVKILDQPKATEGMLVLLAYQRIDGRVRRSEAIQAITLHA